MTNLATQQTADTNTQKNKKTKPVRLITIDDVMDKIGMRRNFVYNEIKAGRIRPVKMGRVNRFVEAEIDQWLLDRLAERE